MKNRLSVACILMSIYIVSLHSCKQNETEDIKQLAGKFSALECRAFTLREQRYSLADKIRFLEDSITKAVGDEAARKNLQNHLSTYLKDKEDILSVSLRLADTIKLQLDTIVKIRLRSRDKIELFDKTLSAELERKHCR